MCKKLIRLTALTGSIVVGLACASAGAQDIASAIKISTASVEVAAVDRLPGNPMISPYMIPGVDGENINGPSIIRVPEWLPEPLGQYYLYFAHHKGSYIRMAYADSLSGPWQIHEPGTLRVDQTRCDDLPHPERVPGVHVASPDVHVDNNSRQIRMYFHCHVFLGGEPLADYPQRTLVATSNDGIEFDARKEILGNSYFRVFEWSGSYYALGKPGVFYKSEDGLTDFEEGPTLFTANMRHSAVMVRDNRLLVFYTVIGDDPERILLSEIELTPDWMSWKKTDPLLVIEPETEWEGGSIPSAPSQRSFAVGPVRQLRDPALFHEDGETYLVYAVAGEQGIAIARLGLNHNRN